jgi:hypothetical protein
VYGEAASNGLDSYGVFGEAHSDQVVTGVHAFGHDGNFNGWGVYAAANLNGNHGYGVNGIAFGNGGIGYGVYGQASSNTSANWAGYFAGDVNVTGTIFTPAFITRIDHPIDPANQMLKLASVSAPEHKAFYDGIVRTDSNGEATVIMPDYFSSLATEFRYQLTVIGEFAQAIVLRKIENGQFTIKTDKPNVEVSWLVTGIRRDAFAMNNEFQVQSPKPPHEVGKYYHPSAFGVSREHGVDYEHEKAVEEVTLRTKKPGILQEASER